MFWVEIDYTWKCKWNYNDSGLFAYEFAKFKEDSKQSAHPTPELPVICNDCKFKEDCEIFALTSLEALQKNLNKKKELRLLFLRDSQPSLYDGYEETYLQPELFLSCSLSS